AAARSAPCGARSTARSPRAAYSSPTCASRPRRCAWWTSTVRRACSCATCRAWSRSCRSRSGPGASPRSTSCATPTSSGRCRGTCSTRAARDRGLRAVALGGPRAVPVEVLVGVAHVVVDGRHALGHLEVPVHELAEGHRRARRPRDVAPLLRPQRRVEAQALVETDAADLLVPPRPADGCVELGGPAAHRPLEERGLAEPEVDPRERVGCEVVDV